MERFQTNRAGGRVCWIVKEKERLTAAVSEILWIIDTQPIPFQTFTTVSFACLLVPHVGSFPLVKRNGEESRDNELQPRLQDVAPGYTILGDRNVWPRPVDRCPASL